MTNSVWQRCDKPSERVLRYLGDFTLMSLQLADELVCRGVVDTARAVSRGRQQVLTGEVEPDVEHFIVVTT